MCSPLALPPDEWATVALFLDNRLLRALVTALRGPRYHPIVRAITKGPATLLLTEFPGPEIEQVYHLLTIKYLGGWKNGLVRDFINDHYDEIVGLEYAESLDRVPVELRSKVTEVYLKLQKPPVQGFENITTVHLPVMYLLEDLMDFTRFRRLRRVSVDKGLCHKKNPVCYLALPPLVEELHFDGSLAKFANVDFPLLRLFYYGHFCGPLQFHEDTTSASFPKLTHLEWRTMRGINQVLPLWGASLTSVKSWCPINKKFRHLPCFAGIGPDGLPLTEFYGTLGDTIPPTATYVNLCSFVSKSFTLPPLVTELSLNHKFDPGFFPSCSNLRLLEIRSSCDDVYDLWDLSGMRSLRSLSVFLVEVKHVRLPGLVENVEMVGCGIRSIEVPVLIVSLNVSTNKLTEVPVDRRHENLRKLNVEDNPLAGPTVVFSLPNLEELHAYSVRVPHIVVPKSLPTAKWAQEVTTVSYLGEPVEEGTICLLRQQEVDHKKDVFQNAIQRYRYHPDTTEVKLTCSGIYNPSKLEFPPLMRATITFDRVTPHNIVHALQKCSVRYLEVKLDRWPNGKYPLEIPALVESLRIHNEGLHKVGKASIKCLGKNPQLRELFITTPKFEYCNAYRFVGKNRPNLKYVNGFRTRVASTRPILLHHGYLLPEDFN